MQELEDSQIAQLALCAKSGLDNPDSGLGCYAVDPKNYDEFAMFFDKVRVREAADVFCLQRSERFVVLTITATPHHHYHYYYHSHCH